MRALLRQPELLLLDEATSSLDSRSEKEVQDAIDKVTKTSSDTRTIMTIAHRLSTIQDCDLILVISDGTLVEQGDHNTLMAKGGRLRFVLQTGQKSKNMKMKFSQKTQFRSLTHRLCCIVVKEIKIFI